MGERVLIVGEGGREHALGQEIAKSDEVEAIFFAPGNAGTGFSSANPGVNEELSKFENLYHHNGKPIKINHFGAIADASEGVDYVLIGPEKPLAKGLADILRNDGRTVIGAGAEAAKLEADNDWAAQRMKEWGIKTPKFETFTDFEDAWDRAKKSKPSTYVIKANELADGKGVELPKSHKDAKLILQKMFSGEGYGGAGKNKVMFQGRIHGGKERTVIMARDRYGFAVLPVFPQDHKRLKAGDKGKNTGGMGAWAEGTESRLSKQELNQIEETADRIHQGLAALGIDDQCIVFIGYIFKEGVGYVIEFNVRFGNPETQVQAPLMNRGNKETMHNLLHATAHNDLKNFIMPKDLGGAALTVALVSEGYPNPKKARGGEEILGLERDYPNVTVQHGSTRRKGDKVVTRGGRELFVTGIDENVDEAAQDAFAAIGEQAIHFAGMLYREDIGWQVRSSW